MADQDESRACGSSTTSFLAKSWRVTHILDMPDEVLGHIFCLLAGHSVSDVASAEASCVRFRLVIQRLRLYANRCHSMLRAQPAALKPLFLLHQFEPRIQHDSCLSKQFLLSLIQLESNWRGTVTPSVRQMDCLGVIQGVRGLGAPIGWDRIHNYQGVYDSIWIPERGLFVCSVNDTIQVWDMSEYSCKNLILGSSLDVNDVKVTCFSVWPAGNQLICGTNRGHIHVYNLFSGSLLAVVRGHSGDVICDVHVHADVLMSVDCRGQVRLYRPEHSGSAPWIPLLSVTPTNPDAELSRLYAVREKERQLAFNQWICCTNVRRVLCVWPVHCPEASVWIKTHSIVLCCQVVGRDVFWGEQTGSLYQFTSDRATWPPATLISNPDDVIQTRYRTVFKDSITCLSVCGNLLAAGDVNGDIHVCRVPLSSDCLLFTLDRAHRFGSYVWCIQLDAARIMSGDSDGQLLVHDFWPSKEIR